MATGKYDSGDVQVIFSGNLSTKDVGSELSVIQTFVDDIALECLVILDVTITKEQFAALPEALRDAIEALAQEVEFEE